MVQGVDYRIPMSAQGLSLQGLGDAYLANNQNKRQNALLELQQSQNARTQEAHDTKMQHLAAEDRNKSILQGALQIKSFLDRGDNAGAIRAYRKRVQDIYARGGNPSDTLELDPYFANGDFEGAKNLLDDTIGNFRQMGYLSSSGGMTPYQKESLRIQDEKLALDRDKFNNTVEMSDSRDRTLDIREQELELKRRAEDRMTTKLSAPAEKALIDSQDLVVSAQRDASQFDRLADEFELLNSGGASVTLAEGVKQILGTQDAETEFRRRFNKVRLSEGLKNLPPGPATDRDVQEAFKGVPQPNASPAQVASFLRGAAKMARFQAGYNQFKADAISRNGNVRNLNKQWRSKVMSSALDREVTVAEIYAEAQMQGMAPEEVAAELGVSWDY